MEYFSDKRFLKISLGKEYVKPGKNSQLKKKTRLIAFPVQTVSVFLCLLPKDPRTGLCTVHMVQI